MRFATPKTNLVRLSSLVLTLLISGATMADPLSELKIVGEAKLKVLFWDVYDSSLFNQTGIYQAGQFPQALKINYLRDIDAEDLVATTQQEWQKLGIEPASFEVWIPLLAEIFPDIKKGDTLLLDVGENRHSEFYFNGKSIGKIRDENFGPSFLRIWLDQNCSYPKVRRQLLGLNK
ncbi:MAG: chalcone isomerase family protein [Paraglaciecola sp.]|uniref:chalcone isomerase family protein n=1 Tax=Paraglaciecola sp. TaxID=1920173 RepID=UPI0032988484